MADVLQIVQGGRGQRRGVFPHLQSVSGLRHLLSTVDGPDLKSDPTTATHARAMQTLAVEAGLNQVAWARQVHGDRVLEVDQSGFQGEADALICNQPGLGVAVRGADCPLILIAGQGDQGPTAWAAIHASWRCTVAGLVQLTIADMCRRFTFDTAVAQAVICPSAGPCCYEVGEDVRSAALSGLGRDAAAAFREKNGGLYFDLWAENRRQLTETGLYPENIRIAGTCTICRTGVFPGFRREGETAGRYAALIGAEASDIV